jgi:hypothetical protein
MDDWRVNIPARMNQLVTTTQATLQIPRLLSSSPLRFLSRRTPPSLSWVSWSRVQSPAWEVYKRLDASFFFLLFLCVTCIGRALAHDQTQGGSECVENNASIGVRIFGCLKGSSRDLIFFFFSMGYSVEKKVHDASQWPSRAPSHDCRMANPPLDVQWWLARWVMWSRTDLPKRMWSEVADWRPSGAAGAWDRTAGHWT